MKKFITLCLVFFLASCTLFETIDNEKGEEKIAESPLGVSFEEIAKHNVRGDCWLLIESSVYDISEFNAHPGGEIVYDYCGKDATEVFETRPMGSNSPHSFRAKSMLKDFYFAELLK
jgi:cytochrome b involved in lipid metabolism